MKIGEFSTRTGVTADALRHYMELGLLVIEKRGGQYDFDERARRDLERILKLKDMGFSLAEVKMILQFERLGVMTEVQRDVYYRGLYMRRKALIRQEIEARQTALAALEEALRSLEEAAEAKDQTPRQTVGLPLEGLTLLGCTHCGATLALRDGDVRDDRVIRGTLNCSRGCGASSSLLIEEGIVYVSERFQRQASSCGDRPEALEPQDFLPRDSGAESFLETYLTSTDPAYLDRIYQGLNWARERSDFSGGHAALELGSGHGFYLRTVYDRLPEDLVYVAVDRDPVRHRFLKTILEGAAAPRKIVLLCADFEALPLKADSFDILVDFTGSSHYSFESDGFLPALVNPLIRENAKLYGSYIIFEKFGVKTRIPVERRSAFKAQGVLEGLKNLGYDLLETFSTQTVSRGGVYEDYFDADEKV